MADQVLVRMSPTLAAAVRAEAAELSASAWIRRQLADVVHQPDAVHPTPPAKKSRPVLSEAVVEMRRLQGVLGETCGATVQLCKDLRETGHDGVHDEAERVLTALRSGYAQVVDMLHWLREGEA
ncbi:hypothetical protein IHV25_06065 [Phaeovibrio sulfidiphilus]|uniref:Uncharacterized protein n=1 Tax=Phaeovibrio sulfidiphilus TaxID=1220600 RepID=A0A8J6YPG9_9PROT|nr:hypothetical protein [Phaeovibrio sulfidiphilus]MBE1237211.1 hypothetical protein [Phaeovibrio sulfidiphilus]